MMKRSLLFVLALLSITAIQAQLPNWSAELSMMQVTGAPAGEYHFDLFINAAPGTDPIYLNTSGFVIEYDMNAFSAAPTMTLAGSQFANECTFEPEVITNPGLSELFLQSTYFQGTALDVTTTTINPGSIIKDILTIDLNLIPVNNQNDLEQNVAYVDDNIGTHNLGRFVLTNWDGTTDPNLAFLLQSSGSLLYTIVQANNQIDVTAPEFEIEEVPIAGATLPVELVDFYAEKTDDYKVQLHWTTATEINNDRFVIEKKRNGGEFFEIGDVEGAGRGLTTEAQQYDFLDKTAMSEIVSYRLKQVDMDGTFEYSDVVEVSFNFSDANFYLVYPNPVQDVLNLETATNADQVSSWYIADIQGKTLIQGNIEAGAGIEEVNVSNLAQGVYFVRIKNELGQAQVTRFVKL